ncbi:MULTISPECIES: hypothetical protein [unclassified Flavobacterium]|uniref:hypothetical protein n=1 Tax=unclassified Flavobacterium TaxID=196869 RepID=UPI002ECFF1D1
MSAPDYNELESRFHCACEDAIGELSMQYKTHYHSAGKLEDFFGLIQTEFERVVEIFTHKNNLAEDKEAQRRINAIAKEYAKKCVDDYGKVN